jgi:predicted signal transduction protein with EAL and GGDEF domain
MTAAFLLLAWLSFRSMALLPMSVLYLLVMFYGVLQLDRARLVSLAAFALVTHGTALFMVIDHGGKLTLPVAGLQLAALLLAFAWLIYSAGMVLRLRERLAQARSRLHEFEQEANERASRDALTGVYHQQHLVDALEREIARSERLGKPLSIARVDLDWLGALNAAHGQIAGDVAPDAPTRGHQGAATSTCSAAMAAGFLAHAAQSQGGDRRGRAPAHRGRQEADADGRPAAPSYWASRAPQGRNRAW